MTTTEAPVTDDEILRVRRHECETIHGHVFDVLVRRGDTKPSAIECLSCEQVWPVFTPPSQKRRAS